MNDNWMTKEGERWSKEDRDRVTRLFRSHVDTPSNFRRGRSCRIKREPCYFCIQERIAAQGRSEAVIEYLPLGEAHHVDYGLPFVVVWVCASHHRRVDHGTLAVPRRAIRDYTSLITGPYGISIPGALRENRKKKEEEREGTPRNDAPPF